MHWKCIFSVNETEYIVHLVTVFCCICRCTFKSYCKNFKCRVQTKNLQYVQCIWHWRSFNCSSDMFADSSWKFQENVLFQVKVQINLSNRNKNVMLSQFVFTELFFDSAVDLVLSREITNTIIVFGFKAKATPNKTLDKFNSFHSLLVQCRITRTSRPVRRNSNALIFFCSRALYFQEVG